MRKGAFYQTESKTQDKKKKRRTKRPIGEVSAHGVMKNSKSIMEAKQNLAFKEAGQDPERIGGYAIVNGTL